MNYLHGMNVPYGKKPTWGFVLSSSYRLYREHFWAILRIGLPIALLTFVFTPLQRRLVHQLVSFALQHGITFRSSTDWILMNAIPLVIGAVYWSLNALFFAGIAGMLESKEGKEGQAISDAYTPVRKRLRPLLVVALLTWIVFFLARGIMTFAVWSLLERLHFVVRNKLLSALVMGVPLLAIAGLLSRAALAVPELIGDPSISPLRAVRNSITKTENWEPFFMFFMAKAAIVGYGIYWAAQRGFDLLWTRTSISPTAYYWVTWGVYACLFAMLESPLFIAFSMLYRELQLKQEETALAAPAIG